MLDILERLLVLQDRDRKILRTRAELNNLDPQRRQLQTRLADSQAAFDSAKHRSKQIESARKKLELDVDAKKQLIEKYSLQQFQTKKNEEYRALAHEIETCKDAIITLEDQQLELMEQADKVQKEVNAANQVANELKKGIEDQIAQIGLREKNLAQQLTELESNRDELATAIDASTLSRYQRLLANKGESVVVGIDHGVCGGCHMKLTVQSIVSCQGNEEIVSCPNCARLLFFTRDMDLAIVD